MGANPSNNTLNLEDGGADGWKALPVEKVSWYDAIAFCNRLSLLDSRTPAYSVQVGSVEVAWATVTPPTSTNTDWDAATIIAGDGYRLPTEMEWMWAAMGATKGGAAITTDGYDKGYAGSTEGSSQTNVDNYAWHSGNATSSTHEVGNKTANELGLYDISGNVYEWVWDWYASYPSGTKTDFTGLPWSFACGKTPQSLSPRRTQYCTVATEFGATFEAVKNCIIV